MVHQQHNWLSDMSHANSSDPHLSIQMPATVSAGAVSCRCKPGRLSKPGFPFMASALIIESTRRKSHSGICYG
jgi:hypothetical protein